jgi:hypothetical protein
MVEVVPGGRRLRALAGSVLAATCTIAVLASSAAANTITVSTTANAGPGSLREAVEKEVESGGTVVVPAGTYVLTTEQLSVTKSMTIAGAGAASTVITSKHGSRLFKIVGKALTVTISGVTLTEGTEEEEAGKVLGGGIFDSEATLTLEHDVVSHNTVNTDGGPLEGGGISRGGGIYATGPLHLSDVALSGNLVTARGGSESGGGIAEGGALWSEAGATLSSVTFTGNTANADGGTEGGGGIARGGAAWLLEEGAGLTLSSVSATGNLASAAGGDAAGGGISRGGGFYLELEGGSASISALTMAGNSALAPGGTGAGGGIAEGGGLRVFTEIPLTITNATVTGNTSSGAGTPLGEGEGGGIWTSGSGPGVTTIVSSTLDANMSVGDPKGGGGGNLEGEAKVRDTIISGGSGPATRQNCGDPVQSLGNNLEDRNECGLTGPGDKINMNPQLGPLQANGGALMTQAIAQGSPAVDAGASCPATDERGIARPQGAACDIGAYELALPGVVTGPASAVGEHSATLSGTDSNPDFLGGLGFFQFGVSASYGSSSAGAAIGAGVLGNPFSAVVTGLKPATTYHYRAVASNSGGTIAGADATFTTKGASNAASALVLNRLALSPSHLRSLRGHGASLASARGAKLSYHLSDAAKTTLTVLRVRSGFHVGRRCLASLPRGHKGHARHCSLLSTVGSFSHQDTAGKVTLRFTGRVGGKPLAVGSYRLRAVARNSSATSAPATVSFSVVR